eukprot:gene3731-5333_t
MAQTVIQSINSSQQAGVEVVRIELSEPLTAVPKGFVVQTPPQIAVDLPGVSSALGKSEVEVNQGNLRSVNVAQTEERTRLVLNLRQPATYRAELHALPNLIALANLDAAQVCVQGAAVVAVLDDHHVAVAALHTREFHDAVPYGAHRCSRVCKAAT